MTAPAVTSHPRVTWLNAINYGQVSRCFADAESAFDAAATDHPFNNTRVVLGRCDGGDGCALDTAVVALAAAIAPASADARWASLRAYVAAMLATFEQLAVVDGRAVIEQECHIRMCRVFLAEMDKQEAGQ